MTHKPCFGYIKRLILLCFTLIINLSVAYGSKLDSLHQSLKTVKSDSAKINLLLKIGDYHEHTIPDSALYYYDLAYQECENAKEKDSMIKKFKVISLRYQGIVYRKTGNFNKSNSYLQKALDISYKAGLDKKRASVYSSFGALNRNIGNYNNALEYYQKALQINLEIDNKAGVSACYNNIGIVHDIEENYSLALEYYESAIEYFRKQNNKLREGITTMNIGSVYVKMGKYKYALNHYDNAKELFISTNNTRGIAQIYNNKAVIFSEKDNLTKALNYLNKSLDIHYNIGDSKGKAATYNNISELYYKLENYKKSIKYAEKGLELSSNIKLLNQEVNAYERLRKAHSELNNYYQASYYADNYITKKDSLHSVEISKSIAEMEAKFQDKKRQLEIQSLQKENELKEAEIKIKNRLITTITISLIVVLFLSALVLYQYFAKKKANLKLISTNTDIQNKSKKILDQRNKIESQYDEIITQRDKVAHQKNLLEIFNHELTDSIYYAKSIQKALLPDTNKLYNYVQDIFVFEKPSDIISGDFYWMHPINRNKVIFALADSTGHGVPGAFMSVLGITLLNNIIIKQKEYRVNEVLDLMREGFITALNQDDTNHINREGIDISIFLYDKSKKEIYFAAAKSKMWLLSNNNELKINTGETKASIPNMKINVYKGDEFPIGLHNNSGSFTKQKIKLDENCKAIYLFSDGFHDQLNQYNQRYTNKKLKNKILEIGHLPLNKQYTILKKEFYNWKGEAQQVDDVTIIGIKI